MYSEGKSKAPVLLSKGVAEAPFPVVMATGRVASALLDSPQTIPQVQDGEGKDTDAEESIREGESIDADGVTKEDVAFEEGASIDDDVTNAGIDEKANAVTDAGIDDAGA